MIIAIIAVSCTILLIFPLVSFKFGIYAKVLPLFEVIYLYYFINTFKAGVFIQFLFGIFIDEINCMPIGSNSFGFLASLLCIRLFQKYFSLKNEINNLCAFFLYLLVFMSCRYFIMCFKLGYMAHVHYMVFQYLTTAFSYPIIKLVLDKAMGYAK